MGASLSISFTLGKASQPNKVNLKHNNREFIAKNIDNKKTADNITFKSEDIEEAYHKLFDEALDEYNTNQKRQCRKIDNYYRQVCESKKTEPFYEAIVQFGDINTASCDSETGEICKEMLCEYMKEFQKRNPNLYVFNAVLHVDEATPHLHIDFIPFYNNNDRIRGLKKGVSMKSALIEQGCNPTGKRENQLIQFEKTERDYMEQILNNHGMEREDKQAHYDHMTVDEYKAFKDIEHHKNTLANAFANADLDRIKNAEKELKIQNLETQLSEMKKKEKSPYCHFLYSSHDKLAYVLKQLDEADIEYRETENGFEAKEYFRKQIREFEKQFVPSKVNYRDQLREDIDRLIMQAVKYQNITDGLEKLGYEVRRTKYVSVRPKDAKQFIRLNSLGDEYSMQGIKNRIADNQFYKQRIDRKLIEQSSQNIYIGVLQTTKIYFDAFVEHQFPMKRICQAEPFSWKNDVQLDKLAKLNELVTNGADINTFNQRFDNALNDYDALREKVEKIEHDLKVDTAMYNCANIIYGGAPATEKQKNSALGLMKKNPSITKENYKSILAYVDEDKQKLAELKQQLSDVTAKLDETKEQLNAIKKIYNGTYMQSLLRDADIVRYADVIPTGYTDDFITV